MIERWLYKLAQVLSPDMTLYIAAGVLLLMFIYWLIKYQFCLMCVQRKRIRELSRFAGSYKGLKKELIPLLSKEVKGEANRAVWQEYEAAMLARRPAALRNYFTYVRIYDIPCSRERMVCYKWYNLVLGVTFSILGWILIKAGERITLPEAVYSDNFIYIIAILCVTLLLVLLYSVIESGIYASSLKALERFCSLCDRALPSVRKDTAEELRPSLELLLKKQDALFEWLGELEGKIEACSRAVDEGQTACPPAEEESGGE